MIINSFPPTNANTVAPYVPLGQQPISQENSDLKVSSLKALEQSAPSARSENRRVPDDRQKKQDQQPVKADKQVRETQTAEEKKAEIQAKERLIEEKEKAQRAEEAKKNAQEERYRAQEQKELMQEEKEAARRNTERVEGFIAATNKTINVSRRLVEIGAVKGSPAVGNFLNYRV